LVAPPEMVPDSVKVIPVATSMPLVERDCNVMLRAEVTVVAPPMEIAESVPPLRLITAVESPRLLSAPNSTLPALMVSGLPMTAGSSVTLAPS